MPHLDYRAGDWCAIFVHDPCADLDQLAERALRAVPREVAAHRCEPARDAGGAGELGARLRALDERLRGPALEGLRVAGDGAFGLRLRIAFRQGKMRHG